MTLMIVILMAIFILRDRKRRRRWTVDSFGSQCSFGNTGPPSPPGTNTFEKISSTERAINGDSKERSGINLPYIRGAWEVKNGDRPTSTSSWLYDDTWGEWLL